ncbi:MAG: glycosyl hydrolase family 28-related protein [Acidiferrobacteraceae bacterium]
MRRPGLALALLLLAGQAFGQGVVTPNTFALTPYQVPGASTSSDLAVRSEHRLDLVADFGADPTGTTDISGALNAAIATGQPIFIPAGNYLLSGSVTDPAGQNVDIVCAGPAASTINLAGSIAISQTGQFTIYFSLRSCGVTFTGASQISLAGTAYNNSQPLQGPLFDNDYFYVPTTYTGAGPVLNFTYVSSGRMTNNTGLIDAYGAGILDNFIEISGVSMNWEFGENQFWDNVNPSNTANVSTGLFLNGSTGGGVQGTRISNNEFVGFSKDLYIGPNNNTVQVSNNMFDQGYYPIYVSGASINDIRITNNYLASSAAANAGAAGIYLGAASGVNVYGNIITNYNSGNFGADLTTATNNSVWMWNNNIGPINNPNNVSLANTNSSGGTGAISAPNVLGTQNLYASSATLPVSQAGSYIFWIGSSAGTLTLPSSTAFGTLSTSLGGGVYYIQNNGTANVTIQTGATDLNKLPGASGTLGGTEVLSPGQSVMAVAAGAGATPQWVNFGPTNVYALNSVGPVAAKNFTGNNTLNGQLTLTASTALTAAQSGEYVYWVGAGGDTITLPNSTDFATVGGGLFYIRNSGSGPVSIATVSTDHNYLPGGANTLGGSIVLNVGQAVLAIPNPGAPAWTSGSPNTFGSITAASLVTGSNIAAPSIATLATNPPVSATAYQWIGPGVLELACPVTLSPTSSAAATATLDIGSTSTPTAQADSISLPATAVAGQISTAHAEVPAGWYYELTVANTTIDTCVGVVH